MKRPLIRCAILLVWMLSLSLPAIGQPRTGVKVGVLLSLSGDLAQWCGYIRRGLELAASEGGPIPIELIVEDDRSIDRRTVLSAMKKLLYVDKVDLVFTWTISPLPVLAPVVERGETPLLIGAYDSRVPKSGAYVFGAFVNYELLPREIAQFFYRKGARRFAVVSAADNWSQSFEAPFRDEVRKLGAEVVLSETLLPSESDTRSLVLKLKKERIDAVLAPLYGNSLYSFVREARQMQYAGIIHVADGVFEEDIKVVGPSIQGVFASQIALTSPELSAKLGKREGEKVNPFQLGLLATGYDTIKHIQKMALSLQEKGAPLTRESLHKALQSYESEGYLGRLMFGAAPPTSGAKHVVIQGDGFMQVE